MTWDAMLAAHAQGALAAALHGGESCTYQFANGADPRQIPVQVISRTLEPGGPGLGRVARRRAVLSIALHESLGVLAIADGDSVLFPIEHATAEFVTCRIRRVLYRDTASVHVEVQA